MAGDTPFAGDDVEWDFGVPLDRTLDQSDESDSEDPFDRHISDPFGGRNPFDEPPLRRLTSVPEGEMIREFPDVVDETGEKIYAVTFPGEARGKARESVRNEANPLDIEEVSEDFGHENGRVPTDENFEAFERQRAFYKGAATTVSSDSDSEAFDEGPVVVATRTKAKRITLGSSSGSEEEADVSGDEHAASSGFLNREREMISELVATEIDPITGRRVTTTTATQGDGSTEGLRKSMQQALDQFMTDERQQH